LPVISILKRNNFPPPPIIYVKEFLFICGAKFMSDGIELQAGIKAQTVAQNSDLPIEPAELPHNYPTADGIENGGVYFELNLRNNRGRARQQDLLTTFSGENSTESTSFLHENSNSSTFYRGNSSHQKGYEENSTEPIVYGANHSNGNGYGVNSGSRNSTNNSPDWRELSLEDFVELVENNEDFAAFRNQPRELRHDVRRFSESNNIENGGEDLPNVFDEFVDLLERKEDKPKFFDQEDGASFFDEPKDKAKLFETQEDTIKIFDENDENVVKFLGKTVRKNAPPNISEYEKLIAEMNAKKLSPDEFAETLPPKDREIFKARYQLDQTFGTKTLSGDDVNSVQNGELRVNEAAVEKKNQAAALPIEIHIHSIEGENSPTLTSREIAAGTETVVPFSGNTFADSDLKIIESNDLKFQDKSSQVAVGGNTNLIIADSGAVRGINHNVVSESSSNVSAVGRRDGGAAMGGALISGAFASIENYKNAESGQINGSYSIRNTDVYGRSVFSPGATGVMMSAAIGSVIPNSEATVGGVLGFISSVVVGVEAEQGLRWLGGDRPTAIVPSNNTENPLTANLNLQPLLA
jgi:hypothetical protein